MLPSGLELSSGGVPIRMQAQEIRSPTDPVGRRRPAVILLHGSGGHVDFWTGRLGPFLQEGGISLYAPHYFDRTRTVRADLAMISDGVHVPQWLETLGAATRFVASRPGVDPERIILAGISLGAFLCLAYAATLSAAPDAAQSLRTRGLLDVSGGLVEPYASQATARMPRTLILHGGADTIVPVSFAHELDRRLTALGVAHRTEILPGEGHLFSPGALPRILLAVSAFLEECVR